MSDKRYSTKQLLWITKEEFEIELKEEGVLKEYRYKAIKLAIEYRKPLTLKKGLKGTANSILDYILTGED